MHVKNWTGRRNPSDEKYKRCQEEFTVRASFRAEFTVAFGTETCALISFHRAPLKIIKDAIQVPLAYTHSRGKAAGGWS